MSERRPPEEQAPQVPESDWPQDIYRLSAGYTAVEGHPPRGVSGSPVARVEPQGDSSIVDRVVERKLLSDLDERIAALDKKLDILLVRAGLL